MMRILPGHDAGPVRERAKFDRIATQFQRRNLCIHGGSAISDTLAAKDAASPRREVTHHGANKLIVDGDGDYVDWLKQGDADFLCCIL